MGDADIEHFIDSLQVSSVMCSVNELWSLVVFKSLKYRNFVE
jgi:hypothetical protein